VAAGKQWPKWAKNFITPDEAHRVSEAVAQVETKTRGEIVPIIVHSSSSVGHVSWSLTFVLLVSLLVFEVPHFQFFHQWNATWLMFLIAGLCFGVARILSRFDWVQRLLVPQSDQVFQVEERALLEFYQAGVTGTQERTGILLFISLMERKAVVLADHAISERLPKETWEEICRGMIEGIRKGQTAESLIQAIHRSGELLAEHFPHRQENENELSNQLILKE
jgi:putative membrane protein